MTRAVSVAIAVSALLGLALFLSACGGGDTTATGMEAGAKVKGGVTAAPRGERCSAQLRRFVGTLDRLRDVVVVGVTYDAYLAGVRDVQRSYERMPAGKLGIGCLLTVGAPAERSMNLYVEAANTWGNCLADTSCRIASIEAELRRDWDRASTLLSAAQAGRAM
jgi:hypothetical protein